MGKEINDRQETKKHKEAIQPNREREQERKGRRTTCCKIRRKSMRRKEVGEEEWSKRRIKA